jgi:hypothetical protein
MFVVKRSMQQIRRAIEIRRQLKDPEMIRTFGEVMSRYDRSFAMRLYVHEALFNETIWSQVIYFILSISLFLQFLSMFFLFSLFCL